MQCQHLLVLLPVRDHSASRKTASHKVRSNFVTVWAPTGFPEAERIASSLVPCSLVVKPEISTAGGFGLFISAVRCGPLNMAATPVTIPDMAQIPSKAGSTTLLPQLPAQSQPDASPPAPLSHVSSMAKSEQPLSTPIDSTAAEPMPTSDLNRLSNVQLPMTDERSEGTTNPEDPLPPPSLQVKSDPLFSEISEKDVVQPPPAVFVSTAIPQIPQVSITFLLVSGRRKTMSFEPETTVGRVKELVWNAWPSEWPDDQPPAPSHLRILYLGKILQDEDTLSKLSFPIQTPSPTQPLLQVDPQSPPDSNPEPHPQPKSTIVHLSIRPYVAPTDNDAPKKKGRKRRGRSGQAESGIGGGGGVDGIDGEGGEIDDDARCCGCVIG